MDRAGVSVRAGFGGGFGTRVRVWAGLRNGFWRGRLGIGGEGGGGGFLDGGRVVVAGGGAGVFPAGFAVVGGGRRRVIVRLVRRALGRVSSGHRLRLGLERFELSTTLHLYL